ncbi:MAG TPA: zinc ribbon domain-containing protein [Pyrinomonadaceae bacterium]|nr:zinc ribbon domain-containing protein [Pyrinomonadaceae bacterium]
MSEFVSRFDDLSGERGYQFRFYCDACGAGHLSGLRPTRAGAAGTLLRAAGEFLSELVVPAVAPPPGQDEATDPAREEARRAAVREASEHFRRCERCARWVCAEGCWNEAAGRCRHDCTSHAAEEAAAKRHAGTSHEKPAIKTASAATTEVASSPPCDACGAEVGQAKFCPECGTPVQTNAHTACPACGHRPEGDPTFCPECGTKLTA